MASLELPSKEKLREIAARQDAKEKEIKERRRQQQTETSPQDQAARIIQVPDESTTTNLPGFDHNQKNYRGHRERRELQGQTLSSSQRWTDVFMAYPLICNTALISSRHLRRVGDHVNS